MYNGAKVAPSKSSFTDPTYKFRYKIDGKNYTDKITGQRLNKTRNKAFRKKTRGEHSSS